jgi:hypothetical protein
VGDDVKNNEQKIARTESLFRDVNERIAETAERFDSEEAAFVCECSDQECTERVDATLTEYERAREDGTHFLIRPGHENERVERVVERRGLRLAIVEKFNAAVARAVRRSNPRTDSV